MLPCSSLVSRLGRRYKNSMRGVRDLMLMETAPEGASGGLLYVAELHSKSTWSKMDHLVCFLPGLQPCFSLLPTTCRAAGPVALSSGLVLQRARCELPQLCMRCSCTATAGRHEQDRKTQGASQPCGMDPAVVHFPSSWSCLHSILSCQACSHICRNAALKPGM